MSHGGVHLDFVPLTTSAFSLLHDQRSLDALGTISLVKVGAGASPPSALELSRQQQVRAEQAQLQACTLGVHYGDSLARCDRAGVLASAPPGCGGATPLEDAAWRGRMAAMYSEMQALRAAGLTNRSGYTMAAARGARVPTASSSSIRHVPTAWGMRSGRLAPGGCPLPPQDPSGPVEQAIAGRLYC